VLDPCVNWAGEDIAHFAERALTLWGDVDDFRHFLPRIMEVMLDDDGPWCMGVGELLGSKLELAEWTDWPDQEREAIARFALAYWTAGLAGETKAWFDLQDLVEGIARLQLEPQPFISAWRSARSQLALEYLDSFISENWDKLVGSRPDPFMMETRAWLLEPEFGTRIEEYADTTQSVALQIRALREA